MKVLPVGPPNASTLLLGEAPGADEERTGKPFVGASGHELTNILADCGIDRAECRITNVTPYRPPRNDIKTFFHTKTEAKKHDATEVLGRYPKAPILEGLAALHEEIDRCRPTRIIALGDTALWALTGHQGITKWRGSELIYRSPTNENQPPIRVIPTYHPAAILRQWDWRTVACLDILRALSPTPPEPAWEWTIARTFADAQAGIQSLLERAHLGPFRLAVDIETRRHAVIDCIGFASSPTQALCLPLYRSSTNSFLLPPEKEADLIRAIKKLLLHPNTQIIGQNFAYDAQYLAARWGIWPTPAFDTMVGHAVCYPGTPKSLDYLSSIYLPWHRYWKDDTAEAEATGDDLLRWEYNCKDCCITYALEKPIREKIASLGLLTPFRMEMSFWKPIVRTMLRGVRQDLAARRAAVPLIMDQQRDYEMFFSQLQREAFPDVELAKTKKAAPWYRSNPQIGKLLYEVFHLPPQYKKGAKGPTADDDALKKLGKIQPLFRPLFTQLLNYRSLGVFLSTFVLAKLDKDNRLRTSYGQVGTETFRLNSYKSAFNTGGNLQNIPKGD